jgi:soluble lytic murein transglycosylase-like protein
VGAVPTEAQAAAAEVQAQGDEEEGHPVRRRRAALALVVLAGLTGCDDTPDKLAHMRGGPAAAAEAPTLDEVAVAIAAAEAGAPAPAPSSGRWRWRLRGDSPYTELFRAAGERHGVEPAVLEAMARIESGFDPAARGADGEIGLMQFMAETGEDMGVNRADPASSIDGAARLIAGHLQAFGGDYAVAIGAYNAGGGAARAAGGVPKAARRHVAKVMGALVPA